MWSGIPEANGLDPVTRLMCAAGSSTTLPQMTEPASAPNEAKGEGMDAPAAPEASQPASEAAAGPSAGAAAEEKPTSPVPGAAPKKA